MGYWKTKVLPKIKKVFEKNGKKAAAAEAIKSFDDSKEDINKEFEEKKCDLEPKVIEIYEASSAEIKGLVKEPKEAGLKKHSVAVHKFLEELTKIEFPGSKPVSEACSKYGASLVPGPVFFIFEKVSTFIVVTEEKKDEEAKEEVAEATTTTSVEETASRDIAVEEDAKKDEIVGEETKKDVAEAAEPPPPVKAEEAAPEPAAKP